MPKSLTRHGRYRRLPRRPFPSALLAALLAATAGSAWAQVETGLERLLRDPWMLAGARVGLIANATSVDSRLKHAVDLLRDHPQIELVALYAPEHGLAGAAQAGARVADTVDTASGLPVYSLHGDTRDVNFASLHGVDALVFDLHDVGTRYYTYISTLYRVLEAAAAADLRVVVLDRPNPLGGVRVEGPVLRAELISFLGADALPIRHGMTVAELARFFNRDIGAELEVIAMTGWRRDMAFEDTALPWVMPSPNMPTVATALVYPATGLLEGTNLSEGRGTTRPFELLGAPYIDGRALAERLDQLNLPGVQFRAATFKPTFSKYAGTQVSGVQIHVTDKAAFEPVRTGLEVLAKVRDLHPDAFIIDRPEHFDHLVGNRWVRTELLEGTPVSEIMLRFAPDLQSFLSLREGYLLYD